MIYVGLLIRDSVLINETMIKLESGITIWVQCLPGILHSFGGVLTWHLAMTDVLCLISVSYLFYMCFIHEFEFLFDRYPQWVKSR